MSDTCETVKIRSASAPGGYIVINAEDFDPANHHRFDDSAVAACDSAAAENEGPKPKGKSRRSDAD